MLHFFQTYRFCTSTFVRTVPGNFTLDTGMFEQSGKQDVIKKNKTLRREAMAVQMYIFFQITWITIVIRIDRIISLRWNMNCYLVSRVETMETELRGKALHKLTTLAVRLVCRTTFVIPLTPAVVPPTTVVVIVCLANIVTWNVYQWYT